MSPRSAEFMEGARERLKLARMAHESGVPSGVVSAAYYAILYAARAALSEEDLYAKTHSGTWTLFHRTFVTSGRFDAELAGTAQRVQRARELADYEAQPPTAEAAAQVIETTERFVAAIERMLE